MDELNKILEQWHKLPQGEQEQFIRDNVNRFNNKSDSEKEKFLNELKAGTEKVCNEANELIEVLTIREQLDPVLPYISLSTIAGDYFGKSRHWLYQKINGNIVNGKPARFTNEEKRIFKNAINDIINKLQGVQTSLG